MSGSCSPTKVEHGLVRGRGKNWSGAFLPPWEQQMASGWARDGAVQEQIDATVEDAVARVRRRLAAKESLKECEDCSEPIPLGRRRAMPGVRLCIACQEEADAERLEADLYNRRGSKDSQLK